MKEAVGKRAAKLFVEEYERQGDCSSFVVEPVGVSFAVSLQQAVGVHLSEIVAESIESLSGGGDAKGREDGVVNLFGSPAAHRCAAGQQGLPQSDHAGVVDLNAGKLHRSSWDRQGETL